MIVFLNGQFVPEDRAVVSVFDRGFLYGDGLFETLRVLNGQPFRWRQHLERLQRGAGFLGVLLPFSAAELRDFVQQLILRNQMPDALLRLTLSRGVGPRGYSPKGADRPSLVMSLHPAPALDPQNPPRWRLMTSAFRLPANEPLAQFKTCNKLPQVLARAEADAAGADEALLLNTDGLVAEASSSNLFWIERETVTTPPLASGILAGVTREVVFELCSTMGLAVRETSITPEALRQMGGIFLSLSSVGIAEVVTFDGQSVKPSAVTGRIREAYLNLLSEGRV
jgi:branched-chain amino acid aminotransferase